MWNRRLHGAKQATPFLVEGLRKLEYRGYDSAGIAVIAPTGKLQTAKAVGRIAALDERLVETPLTGCIGIGHTAGPRMARRRR